MARTVDEPRPDDGAVGISEVVDRSAGTVQRVGKRDQIASSGGSPDVLEIFAVGMLPTALADFHVLPLHGVRLCEERVDVGLVREVSRHLDPAELDRAIEEGVVFVHAVEAVDVPRSTGRVSH